VVDVPEHKPDSVTGSDSTAAVLTYLVNSKDTASGAAPAATTGGVNPLTLPPAKKAKGKYFKFNITAPDGQPISGKVHHVDFKQGRDLASYNSYEYNDILRPSNREEPMTLVCGIFGYQEIVQLIEYTDPKQTPDVVLDEHETWNVPFKLVRLKKGDVSVMYNVSFYKDAVIMLPRSKEELDELVNMMKSNPNYQIRIHGHTNGTSKRKIIGLGESRNYFEVKGSREKTGSSKELSEDRASAIRDYLVEHGIDKGRMDLMAWGGSNMLVKETSSSARLNDRIEIEIIKD
jgi:outer membrane protein OmpA-like peptidoglycan-associated protein